MHILKYIFSKTYRSQFNNDYTNELCNRFLSEHKRKKEICKSIFGDNSRF